jgi:hypothetical protein
VLRVAEHQVVAAVQVTNWMSMVRLPLMALLEVRMDLQIQVVAGEVDLLVMRM